MSTITSLAELEALYGKPSGPSVIKEVDYLPDDYVALIKASPMMILATCGPQGLDCSPRGDVRGFVRVVDKHTLIFPDRPGNNRVDSLRNIIADHRIATLFLIPGLGTTLRVNGTATISTSESLLASFAVDGKLPKSVVVVKVRSAFFHCARAIIRSGIWDPETYGNTSGLPTAGQMLSALSGGAHDGRAYDEAWPQRAKDTLW